MDLKYKTKTGGQSSEKYITPQHGKAVESYEGDIMSYITKLLKILEQVMKLYLNYEVWIKL